jgi:hypothetical protein
MWTGGLLLRVSQRSEGFRFFRIDMKPKVAVLESKAREIQWHSNIHVQRMHEVFICASRRTCGISIHGKTPLCDIDNHYQELQGEVHGKEAKNHAFPRHLLLIGSSAPSRMHAERIGALTAEQEGTDSDAPAHNCTNTHPHPQEHRYAQ